MGKNSISLFGPFSGCEFRAYHAPSTHTRISYWWSPKSFLSNRFIPANYLSLTFLWNLTETMFTELGPFQNLSIYVQCINMYVHSTITILVLFQHHQDIMIWRNWLSATSTLPLHSIVLLKHSAFINSLKSRFPFCSYIRKLLPFQFVDIVQSVDSQKQHSDIHRLQLIVTMRYQLFNIHPLQKNNTCIFPLTSYTRRANKSSIHSTNNTNINKSVKLFPEDTFIELISWISVLDELIHLCMFGSN